MTLKLAHCPVNVRTIQTAACLATTTLRAVSPGHGIQAQIGPETIRAVEHQVTHRPRGHILTNVGAWSPDGKWIVYDTRSDPAGSLFDGSTIEMVNVHTGHVKVLFHARHGVHCGVVTFNPREPKVVFILGPEHPTPDWQYAFWHRRGVIVDTTDPTGVTSLDARDVTPPFTPGALRGGSHVHVWDGAGKWVSFTYEDAVLARFKAPSPAHDLNLRNVGVSVPGHPVAVGRDNPHNQSGACFSVVVTRTTAEPTPGSDQIKRASEAAWVGTNGYLRADGSRQKHAIAFRGQVVTRQGRTITELFIVDVPENVTLPGAGPLAGTSQRMPYPPKGTIQRQLTFTASRRYPGLQGPRHWPRSSPDGSRIAFLMRDDEGIAQLWTISPNGGQPRQLTHNSRSIASAFTWSPDGRLLAHVMDNSVCVTDAETGRTVRLTPRNDDARAPRPEACVFSPDGSRIAYVRTVPEAGRSYNQIFVLDLVKAD